MSSRVRSYTAFALGAAKAASLELQRIFSRAQLSAVVAGVEPVIPLRKKPVIPCSRLVSRTLMCGWRVFFRALIMRNSARELRVVFR